jgi:hypothetical protein
MESISSQIGKMGRAYGQAAVTQTEYMRIPTKTGSINQMMGMVVVTVSSSALPGST